MVWTNNERMPKHIVNARTEGTKERGRSWEKKLNDEAEEDLQTTRIISWHAVARDRNE
jgi:replication-associated recombination protein RarA